MTEQTTFEEACIIERYVLKENPAIHIEARGYGKWAITHMGNVLDKTGEWEWEPMPSSRTEDFLQRTRWASAQEAFLFIRQWLQTHRPGY